MKKQKQSVPKAALLTILAIVNIVMSSLSNASNPGDISDADLIGAWLIEAIEREPVMEISSASFRFLSDGKMAGNTSCNQFTGDFLSSDGFLTFDDFAVTGMACIEPLLEQERRFAKALRRIRTWKIEDNSLLLLDEYGVQLFRAVGFKSE